MNRILIIGLDGATFDVLSPLIQQGHLPNIRSLIENGICADLISTIPPITGPAWTALATGLDPSNTGIIDFFNRKDEDWKLKPITSFDLKGKAFWDYINQSGLKVGIFNYPMLFPPYPINGFIVSGLGASIDQEITYPLSLKKELDEITDGYEIDISYHLERYNNEDIFLKVIYKYILKQRKALLYLLNKPWDIFIGVISLSDWIQHFFWKHWDSTHNLYDPERSPKYKEEFIQLWDKIDELFGDIIQIAAKTNIFIVSDHGFGPQDQCFNLAKWLNEKGYMIFKHNYKSLAKGSLYKMLKKVKSLIPCDIPKMSKKADKILRPNIGEIIDYDKSRAFCLGHTIPFGAIYINRPKHSSQYINLKKEIIQDISNLDKELCRNDISMEIFLPEEIYNGSKLNFLPDIMFTINNWRCIIEENDIKKPVFIDKPYSIRHTGTHRLNGIFVANGPQIKRGKKLGDVRIYDIFPTILYLMGYSVPENDGKILYEIFKEGIRSNKHYIKNKTTEKEPELDKEAEEKIKERLKGLGYL